MKYGKITLRYGQITVRYVNFLLASTVNITVQMVRLKQSYIMLRGRIKDNAYSCIFHRDWFLNGSVLYSQNTVQNLCVEQLTITDIPGLDLSLRCRSFYTADTGRCRLLGKHFENAYREGSLDQHQLFAVYKPRQHEGAVRSKSKNVGDHHSFHAQIVQYINRAGLR